MNNAKHYLVTLEINVTTAEDDLTFNVSAAYRNHPNNYVKDMMNLMMFKLVAVVRAGWLALERVDPNIESVFSHKLHFDFKQCTDDEWEVSAETEIKDIIGRTLIDLSKRIFMEDPRIDELIALAD
ncbi:hypothetical protein BKK52_10425 [Rodentibacter trehalosifermentans]|uniref:Uncharacterized protein n=1 Tax=Rodentibacter trehalosifermentans TaxID=1908263 RepID=A0A1V3IY37_9PAST|nr:hypothetical protein [Rodentibacter trehalosifermentans]OOF46917.1 hypothetical protein BKK52_10425 [Rodentibacter trehalosifermentans]